MFACINYLEIKGQIISMIRHHPYLYVLGLGGWVQKNGNFCCHSVQCNLDLVTLNLETTCDLVSICNHSGPSQCLKIRGRGARSTVVGIICPLVEIGLTVPPKTGGLVKPPQPPVRLRGRGIICR